MDRSAADSRGEQPRAVSLRGTLHPASPRVATDVAVLLIVLIAAAAAMAVFLRPLLELVVGVGSLVLGVWGIRSVLVPGSITYTTVVDLSLAVVLLFLLGAITVRSLLTLWDRNRLPLPRWARSASAGVQAGPATSPNGASRRNAPREGTRQQRKQP